jgi:DNA-binding CsgD family transcriptional regulator
MSTHYPTGASGWVEKCAASGIDIEASTNAFIAQIRQARSSSREARELFTVGEEEASQNTLVQPMRASSLTPAENEVMAFIASGLTQYEIAAERHCSINTVKDHSQAALRKLGARNSPHAVARWYQQLVKDALAA